jgi:hypothetical protein
VDVRIGVIQSMRELDLELDDSVDRDALGQEIEAAVEKGTGMLWFTDRKGRRVGIPVASMAYVELGSHGEGRSIGFSA